jgi:hypothetical protein
MLFASIFAFLTTPFFGAPVPPKVTVYIHGTHKSSGIVPQWECVKFAHKFTHHKHGLYKASEAYHQYMYTMISKNVYEGDPERFPLEHLYFFVWSGSLSHKARIIAAKELNGAMNKLVESYKVEPKITFITHSHGGNVALNLSAIEDQKNYHVDTLVMLASPVQETTKHHVQDAHLFKDIYAPHSHGDFIQIGDPQGARPRRKFIRHFFTNQGRKKKLPHKMVPLFSQRHFPKGSRVKEISVKMGPFSIDHVHFMYPHFSRQIGLLLKKAAKHDFSKREMTYQLGWWNFFKSWF